MVEAAGTLTSWEMCCYSLCVHLYRKFKSGFLLSSSIGRKKKKPDRLKLIARRSLLLLNLNYLYCSVLITDGHWGLISLHISTVLTKYKKLLVIICGYFGMNVYGIQYWVEGKRMSHPGCLTRQCLSPRLAVLGRNFFPPGETFFSLWKHTHMHNIYTQYTHTHMLLYIWVSFFRVNSPHRYSCTICILNEMCYFKMLIIWEICMSILQGLEWFFFFFLWNTSVFSLTLELWWIEWRSTCT